MFKKIIQKRLEQLTKRYLKKHQPKLIVITGSVGKTSTKMAIATVLSEKYRVRVHDGNHNTHMSVPCAILGVTYPENVHSIAAWLNVFAAAQVRIREELDVDVIIQELGTDAPGDIAHFGTYLHPNIAVVTSVSAEHMEFFKTLDAVAKEELGIAKFSDLTVINRDDVDKSFATYADTRTIDTYGLSEQAEYWIELNPGNPLDGKMGRFHAPDAETFSINAQLVGTHNIKSLVAAGLVGLKLSLTTQQIAVGIAKVTPVAGRMQLLRGLGETTIIDDTYNSSPLAVQAALETLYAIDAPQRIAILGSMNELGEQSKAMHEAVAKLCDPAKLSWLVTVGDEANKYIAPLAQKRGVQVRSFESPYQAGGFVHSQLKPGTVVLAKGSENGIFTEEAVKVLLHSTEDEQKLVRQSDAWLERKRSLFSDQAMVP